MEFNKVVEHLEKMMYKYIDDPTIEIEARIGIFDDEKQFSSNIGDRYFETIKKMLDCGTGENWVKHEKCEQQTDYFNGKYRLTVCEDGSQRCIEKKRLENVNFVIENGPFDFRISFSSETPVDVDSFPMKDKCKYSRIKKRFKYEYKMWDFDLTEINQKVDEGEELSFEYEIELNNQRNKTKNVKYLSESILLKILDTVKICDEDEEEEYKIKVVN